MQRRKMVLLVSVVLFMLVAPLAYGQAPAPGTSKPASGGDKWEFGVTPYFWAVQIDSKVTVKGYSAESTTYFSDIWKNLDGGFLMHLEALKGGKWGFFLDGIYLKIRADGDFQRVRTAGLATPPTRDLTLTTEAWIVEFGGVYQLGKWPIAGKADQAVSLDALGGGRYWYMSLDLDTSSPINPSGSDQWVDPFVGARLNIDLTRKLSFNLRGDVGGFGVGSDITWNGWGIFGYRFTPSITSYLGYRAMYVDYKKSTSRARYEETFQGPIGGISFVF